MRVALSLFNVYAITLQNIGLQSSHVVVFFAYLLLLRSKSVNLDGSINNPAIQGNSTNIPIDMGSEWLYADKDMEGKQPLSHLFLEFHLSSSHKYLFCAAVSSKMLLSVVNI